MKNAIIESNASESRVPSIAKNATCSEYEPYPWILSPALDMLFACGGLVWILFGMHFLIDTYSPWSAEALGLMFISAMGMHVFTEAHTVATLPVVYRDKATISRYSGYTCGLATLSMILIPFAILQPIIAGALVKIYLLLVPHHFMAQTYGIFMLYLAKRRCRLHVLERRIIVLFVHSVTWFAVLRQLTYRQWSGETFYSLHIPFWGPLPQEILLVGKTVLIIATALFIAMLIRRQLSTVLPAIPLPAQLALATSTAAFVLDYQSHGLYWLYLAAYYHGAQYMVIVSAQRIKQRGLIEPEKIADKLVSVNILGFYILIAALSFIFFLLIPYLLTLTGYDFYLSLAAIFTIVNIFHILTDGAIWKLKDKDTREFLVS
jgi:hypothetical protein